ncbi:ribokinase [Rhodobacteraceae bacterium NNCM2]|nr:ribokinase [Coraliihabitans acroporae]
MTIHCFGSINIDHVHRVPHFPAAGETLADTGYATGLGGKGCNQARAAAAAGAEVAMIAAVGPDGGWAIDLLKKAGVDTSQVAEVSAATGHAVIYVTPDGENRIVIHAGANHAITPAMIDAALARAHPGDWWLCQNETALVEEAAKAAKLAGLKVAYAAAPFDPAAAARLLPLADLVAVNAVEAAALAAHCGVAEHQIPVPDLLVTEGAAGARHFSGGVETRIAPFAVTPVDTTGAGDTFLGTLIAGFDLGLPMADCFRRASAAAALQITRAGAGDAIPDRAEVDRFLAERS